MEIPKDQILKLLHDRGDHDTAQQADQQLPDQVDTEQHSDLLGKLGINRVLGHFRNWSGRWRSLSLRRRGPRFLSPRQGLAGATEVLSESEAIALIKACSTRAPGVRNRALLAVLWRSGLRISEALAEEGARHRDQDPRAGRHPRNRVAVSFG